MSHAAPHGSKLAYFAPVWWLIAPGALAIVVLMMAVSSAPRGAGAASCPGQFTIDFAGLPAGTIIDEQYADLGVHISGVAYGSAPDALIVFDTNAPPTHDPDLAVDIGNIAVIAKHLTDSNGDGLVDDPDENDTGGIATFLFDQDVRVGSYLFIDKDHGNPNFAEAYNATGQLITHVDVPIGANASVQQVNVNADGVRRLVLDFNESGGFTGIGVTCEQPTPTATAPATPSPTATATAPPTATPSAPPTPTTVAETPTPTPAPSPTPPVAAAAATPAPITNAADTSTQQGPTAGDLPAGGGPPADGGISFGWSAVLASLLAVLCGLIVWMQKTRGSAS
jgi:hypothetical protein